MRIVKAVLGYFGNLVGGIVILLIVCVVAYGGFWLIGKEGDLTGGNGSSLGPPEPKVEALKSSMRLIATYCEYGAVSAVQLRGCYFHVNVNEIEGRDTNAARWARGELNECLGDAGPFCSASYRKTIEDRIASKQLPEGKLNELENAP